VESNPPGMRNDKKSHMTPGARDYDFWCVARAARPLWRPGAAAGNFAAWDRSDTP